MKRRGSMARSRERDEKRLIEGSNPTKVPAFEKRLKNGIAIQQILGTF
jgi:hypothetical protein